MDYSLAALKIFCGQLHEARHISSSPPAMTLHDIRFQRAWLQGVLVSGSDEGLFLLDDGSGVVKLSLHAESSPPNWKSGMYVMVVGLYMDGDPPQIKDKITNGYLQASTFSSRLTYYSIPPRRKGSRDKSESRGRDSRSIAMASITMTASIFAASRPSSVNRRSAVVAKVAAGPQEVAPSTVLLEGEESSSSRRGVMVAAAAAALCTVNGIAVALEEPKRGTLEAKRKYAPVCVTMPTARICHK